MRSHQVGNNAIKSLREQAPTLLDIISTFPSCKIPFARLLEFLPRLPPRYYSIASSPRNDKSLAYVAFNVVSYESNGRKCRGLCSGFLDDLTGSLQPGSDVKSIDNVEILAFPKPPMELALTIPEDPSRPLILISAGTGVTPFFGMIEDLCVSQLNMNLRKDGLPVTASSPLRKVWLFQGVRFEGEDGDMLYHDQLKKAVDMKVLTRLSVAYSRAEKKQYVQDKIAECWEELKKWIDEGALIYVCGSNAMAKDVNAKLVELFNSVGLNGVEQVADLMKGKRYIREIWG